MVSFSLFLWFLAPAAPSPSPPPANLKLSRQVRNSQTPGCARAMALASALFCKAGLGRKLTPLQLRLVRCALKPAYPPPIQGGGLGSGAAVHSPPTGPPPSRGWYRGWGWVCDTGVEARSFGSRAHP